MQRAWAVAWRNLRRNRRRNVATAAAIAFGYAGLVVMGGYASRIEHFLRTNAVYLQHSGHVVVWAEGGLKKASAEPVKHQLDPATQQRVLAWAAKDPRVEFAGRYLKGIVLAGNGCVTQPAFVIGVEAEALGKTINHPEVLAWSPEIARPLKGGWPDAYPALPHAAAVSAGLATILQKPRIHDEAVGLPPAPTVLDCDTPAEKDELGRDANVQIVSVTYDGIFNAVDAEMVSTYHATETNLEDGAVTMLFPALQELFATDRATYIALYLRDEGAAAAVARDLETALAADGVRIQALPYDDERANPYYVGTMAFLGSMIGFITMLVALVLVLTVLGAMTLTILERTREFGTWRAIGFGRGHLVGLVVREALLLALLGLGIGLGMGLIAAAGINAAGIRFSPPGVPGTIALLIHPSVRACALQAAVLIPGVCLAAWLVVRAQVRRGVVDLLTAQSG